jgi:hypothetical protein
LQEEKNVIRERVVGLVGLGVGGYATQKLTRSGLKKLSAKHRRKISLGLRRSKKVRKAARKRKRRL